MKRLVALYRSPTYSPAQHRSNDTAILDDTIAAMEQRGWQVTRSGEADVAAGRLPAADLYVNMCQGPAASERLLNLVPAEALAVNPPESVLNCHRHRLVGHMAAAGLPFPRTLIVPTADPDALLPLVHQLNGDGRPVWVKRGDVHAETSADVVAAKEAGVTDAIARFARRRARSVRRRCGIPAARRAGADRPQRLAVLCPRARRRRRRDRRVHRRESRNRKTRMTDLATTQSESQRVFDLEAQHLAPGTQSVALFSKLCMDRGEGAVLWDVDANRSGDLLAGVGVATRGYAHPRYVAEMTRQLERVHVGSFTSEHRAALVKLIAELAPGDLNRTQLYSSGAEAVEAAVRLAKAATGRHEVVGFWGGFHGKTGGVLPLLSGSFKHGLGPLTPGNYSTPYASCARCAFGKTFPSCEWHCVDFLKAKIAAETTNDIAAIIVEPIQGTAGNIVPPPGYLRQLRALADQLGAVLICDEMICGFGRTGKMFAVEHD